jgi:hypothetical protein
LMCILHAMLVQVRAAVMYSWPWGGVALMVVDIWSGSV